MWKLAVRLSQYWSKIQGGLSEAVSSTKNWIFWVPHGLIDQLFNRIDRLKLGVTFFDHRFGDGNRDLPRHFPQVV